jgi:hypothetical protein
VTVRFVDETEVGFGWIESAPYARSSHALAVDGRVWVLDPIEGDGVDERIRALGEPAGVVILLDRHRRDGEAFAERFGVPLHVAPTDLPETPFEVLPVLRSRFWAECALWWPEPRVLVCADALGTIPFFRAGDEPVGVHPLLRVLKPPRRLRGLEPRHLLVGHGEGLHGDGVAAAVDSAVAGARRRIPRWLANVPRIVRAG